MKINVNYLFHCTRLPPYKDKHYVQIVRFSFSSLSRVTSHRTIHCYHRSVPGYRRDFRTVGYFTVLYGFSMYLILDLICLTSMLKRIFCNMAWAHLTVTQHVLIKMIFGIFAVSCTVHVNFITFLPHLKLSSTAN